MVQIFIAILVQMMFIIIDLQTEKPCVVRKFTQDYFLKNYES